MLQSILRLVMGFSEGGFLEEVQGFDTKVLLISWQQLGVHSLTRNVVRYGQHPHSIHTVPYRATQC